MKKTLPTQYIKYILIRDDLKHACKNGRAPIAKMYTEWEDVKVYEEYVKSVGEESRHYKTCINWYACYAQKPPK
jgi:hypothetical protein